MFITFWNPLSEYCSPDSIWRNFKRQWWDMIFQMLSPPYHIRFCSFAIPITRVQRPEYPWFCSELRHLWNCHILYESLTIIACSLWWTKQKHGDHPFLGQVPSVPPILTTHAVKRLSVACCRFPRLQIVHFEDSSVRGSIESSQNPVKSAGCNVWSCGLGPPNVSPTYAEIH